MQQRWHFEDLGVAQEDGDRVRVVQEEVKEVLLRVDSEVEEDPEEDLEVLEALAQEDEVDFEVGEAN